MSKYKEIFENGKPQNRFVFDYLTINIRDMQPLKVLDMFCDIVKNEDVIPESFIEFDTGALTSYNRSLRFGGDRFITINWRTYVDSETGEVVDCDTRQAVALNITGTGCRFMTEQDFYNLFSYLTHHDVHYTRLDVAFDDFSGVIPVDDMIDSLDSWTPQYKSVSTMSRFSNLRIYKHNSSFGSSYNFDMGSNGSTMKIRLYDKKIEQSRDDVEYWKRLELQLRREKAFDFIDSYLNNKCIPVCYVNFLSSFVRFLVRHNASNLSDVKTALWWEQFLKKIEDYKLLSIYILGIVEEIEKLPSSQSNDTNVLKLRQVLEHKAEHLSLQFGTTLAFLFKTNHDLYYDLLQQGLDKLDDFQCNSTYRKLYDKWKSGDLDNTSLVSNF